MNRSLKELDSVYDKVISALPEYERLTYCEQLIDRTQKTLLHNKKFLTKAIQDHLSNIIAAAQQEIKKIESGVSGSKTSD
ncbi:MAG: hypothetical protein AB1458_05380 [Bacteroidota bacterium]